MRNALCCAVLLIGWMALPAPASAVSVQRCVDASGRVEYRDTACDPGVEMDVIELHPNSVREIDQRAALAAEAALSMRLAMRMQAEAVERQRPPAAHVAPVAFEAEPEPGYDYAWGYGAPRRLDKHRRSAMKPDHHAKRVIDQKVVRRR